MGNLVTQRSTIGEDFGKDFLLVKSNDMDILTQDVQ
jgi:hypothetical protein